MLLNHPCVFAAGETYQIFVHVKKESVMWIKIGDECYYDESNGVLCSSKKVHKITVPAKVLDEAKGYTVCEREFLGKRLAYFSKLKKLNEYYYTFKPVQGDEIRAYHIADAHNREVEPIIAARAFGEIDFLIMNGDIPNHSGNIKHFYSIYKIVGDITQGEIPAVFVRGNHDMRGRYAEHFSDYIPTVNGNTYFTFRLGNIWGIALDCGEDKPDSHIEYGGTICCHQFRKRQTKFIEDVCESDCYKDETITKKLVISHNPFTMHYKKPFNIEEDTYNLWGKLIKENIKPDVMICGHLHTLEICPVEGEKDNFNQPCVMVVGSKPDNKYFCGAGFVFREDSTEVVFTDSKAKILNKCTI